MTQSNWELVEDPTDTQPWEKTAVGVTIAVHIAGETSKIFEANAVTSGDPSHAADGLLVALRRDADRWLYETRSKVRGD